MRIALAPAAILLLVVWAISVAGATAWGLTVNGSLLTVAIALLAVRRFA